MDIDKGVVFEEDYAPYFENLLRFDTLESAEESLRRLDALYRKFSREGDARGVGYCKDLARLGRERANAIAKNEKVRAEKRLEKEEASLWFTIWLQTPDLFFDWLELRKGTEDFRRKFGG